MKFAPIDITGSPTWKRYSNIPSTVNTRRQTVFTWPTTSRSECQLKVTDAISSNRWIIVSRDLHSEENLLLSTSESWRSGCGGVGPANALSTTAQYWYSGNAFVCVSHDGLSPPSIHLSTVYLSCASVDQFPVLKPYVTQVHTSTPCTAFRAPVNVVRKLASGQTQVHWATFVSQYSVGQVGGVNLIWRVKSTRSSQKYDFKVCFAHTYLRKYRRFWFTVYTERITKHFWRFMW